MSPTPVLDAKTMRLLQRLGIVVGIVVVLLIVFGMVRKFLSKSKQTTATTGGTKPDGTPTTQPTYNSYHIELADRLKVATGWIGFTDENRCQTILDFDLLENNDLYLTSQYYKKTYNQTLFQAFDSMLLTGCWSGGSAELTSIKEKTEKANF